ncbi:MAG: hypothetical protein IK076_05895 [Bacteroidales bacterium]|nr:hypothetical protein [Bacteroidales bacterium]
MTKAEQRAFEAYPVDMHPLNYQDLIDQFGGKTEIDVNTYPRCLFQEGYEQAEKDLGLTIEDIEKIHTFLYAIKNNKQGVFTFTRLSDGQYNEVLRRFKEAKK